ncbi:pyridoxal kinase [Syncephalastrum racemosum]|uniref:pyridoxal kinase n=1 Tax=Syncephalastrum racemosum TaxID=13706 RepID=A0A1X2H3L6_SYNRA|nr:pyridoxal kinase [Syncephalastrum racemosum]
MRVLSIQSHMVSGYCGNKAATFPLQLLGFDVDILNTVQFSNHTGYPSWTGKRLDAEEVQDLFDGLEKNGLSEDYTHVLTGYIGNIAILETIERMVKKLKAKNPNLVYVCDPVMGDWGRIYVAPEIVPLYRDLLRVTSVITPNQFEAELLTETTIDSLDSARAAARKLHALGVPNVIITTLKLDKVPGQLHIEPKEPDVEPLYCLTSQEDGKEQHLIAFPTFHGYFTGTGDLFSALVVARWQEQLETNQSLAEATVRVVQSVNAITHDTWQHQTRRLQSEYKGGRPPNPADVKACELRLIQGKAHIEHPERVDTVKQTRLD